MTRRQEQYPERSYGDVVVGSILAVVIAVVILLFTIGPAKLAESARSFNWTETKCVVVEFAEKSRHDDDLTAVLTYEYEFDGKKWRGRYAVSADSEKELEWERDRFVPGAEFKCYVDPANPSKSVFERVHSDFEMFVIFIGAIVLVALCVGLVLAFQIRSRSSGTKSKKAVFLRRLRKSGWLALAAFIFLVGCVAFYYAGIATFILAYDSRSWRPAKARILKSELVIEREHGFSDYDLLLEYEYEFKHVKHTASRLCLFDFDDRLSSKEGIKDVVAKYPVGLETTCFVNPDDPGEAVLERDLSWTLLGGLFPIALIAFGIRFFINVLWEDEGDAGMFETAGAVAPAACRSPVSGRFEFRRSTAPGEPLWAICLILLMCGLAALVRGLYVWRPGSWSFAGDPIVLCAAFIFVLGLCSVVWTVLKEGSRDYALTLHVGSFGSGGECRAVWKLTKA